ncbi:hypothetical protein TUM19329_14440 [Legionella antarctica]|uniref:Uncharacterized protein n=1 Tax=Legionella antarctica TaxID=2708020 RepID=A0A6F8T4E8_9GAMM|nr:hypothetical protein TUM19329_14440 [Legionella antarctica]
MDNNIDIQINPGAIVLMSMISGLRVKGKINNNIRKNKHELTKYLIWRTWISSSRLNCFTNNENPEITKKTPDNQTYLKINFDEK